MFRILSFLIFFSPSILLANFCNDFENYLKNRVETKEILNDKSSSKRFGFSEYRDINKDTLTRYLYDDLYYPYLRDPEKNLVIYEVDYGGPFHKADIRHMDRLIKINDYVISEMSDEEYDVIFDSIKDDEITFTFQLLQKVNDDYFVREGFEETNGYTEIKLLAEEITQNNTVYSILAPIDLIEVRPERYEIDLEYITVTSFTDLQSSEFVDSYGLKEFKSCNYYLSPQESPYIKYNLFNPQIIKENLIEDKSNKQNILMFNIFPKTDEDKSQINVGIKQRKVSTFSQYFDFHLFPFESHYINISLVPDYTSYELSHNINSNYFDSIYFSNKLSSQMFTANFDIIDSGYFVEVDDNVQDSMITENIITWIEIKRDSFYFLAKIVAPIFLILLLSWSVFFLKPKDIESRLTVSIICFLSLIAYNFVIEDSIPKLSYYTWMDWYVSFSYIFCGLTTFFTIYDYQLINKNAKKFKITEAMRSSGIFIFILLNIVSFYILRFQEQGYLKYDTVS